MKGCAAISIGLLFLALGGYAQQAQKSFSAGPKIVSVTPTDGGVVLGFLPPPQDANSPAILEYSIECSVPSDPASGTAMFVYEDVTDYSANIIGLQDGVQYTCVMFARGATDGLLPRGIDSPASNPTPLFTPVKGGSPTIYLESQTVQEGSQPSQTQQTVPEPVAVPPTAEEVAPKVVLPPAPTIKSADVSGNKVELIFAMPKGQETSPVTGLVGACQSNGGATPYISAPIIVPAGSTSMTIKDLVPGEYTCSIAARTADGLGKSAIKVVTVAKPQDKQQAQPQTQPAQAAQPDQAAQPAPPVQKADSSKPQVDQKSAGFKPAVSFMAMVITIAAIIFI